MLLHIIFSHLAINPLILYKKDRLLGNKTSKIVKSSKILNLKDAGYEFSKKWFSYYLLHKALRLQIYLMISKVIIVAFCLAFTSKVTFRLHIWIARFIK